MALDRGNYLMHELSIAESILDGIRTELLRYPGARPVKVGVRIGELAAVDVDSLTFCFEAVVHGTEWESLRLDARVCKQVRECAECGAKFDVVDYNAVCPQCASSNTTLQSGDELDFDYLEVETDGTPATQV
jgi:hydrogenase nickel incorporation protein HypA/HybF